MSLGMNVAGIALLLALVYLYRLQITKPMLPAETEPLTAASIHTIEAAFLRAGACGVRTLREAAQRCGRRLAGSLDPYEIEGDLAGRGFAFADTTKRTMRRARNILLVIVVLAAAVTIHGATVDNPVVQVRRVVVPFVSLYVLALVGIVLVTHLGTSTARGRAALAMRRAAYPLRLLNDVDPAEAVALYGGSVRLRSEMRGTPGSDSSSCQYVWAGGGESVHVDGAGHASSHSCGGSSCGGSSCGGH